MLMWPQRQFIRPIAFPSGPAQYVIPSSSTLDPTPIALPAGPPHYVIPCSSRLDPPYSFRTPTFPFPRFPWPFESETRAAGTGLIWGAQCPPWMTSAWTAVRR